MRVERHRVAPLDPEEPSAAPVGELEEASVGAVDVEPQVLGVRDVGDRVERIDRARVRGAGARRHEERAHAGRAVLGDHPPEGVGVHPELVVGRHEANVPLREAGDRRGLRHARVRLLAHVVRAVEEVLAELRVPRRDHRGQVRHRAAGQQQSLRTLGVVEEVAQPPGDVLLDLDHGGARLPQAHVPVHALGDEVGERGRVQAAARDIGEVARTRVLEGLRDRGLRLGEQLVEVAALFGCGRTQLAGELDRSVGRVGGRVVEPVDEADQVVEGGLAHRAHVLRAPDRADTWRPS